MKMMELSAATESLADYAKHLDEDTIVLKVGNKPIAALVPFGEGDDWESIRLSTNPTFLRIIERSRASYREKGGVPLKEVRRRLGLPATTKKRRTKAIR